MNFSNSSNASALLALASILNSASSFGRPPPLLPGWNLVERFGLVFAIPFSFRFHGNPNMKAGHVDNLAF